MMENMSGKQVFILSMCAIIVVGGVAVVALVLWLGGAQGAQTNGGAINVFETAETQALIDELGELQALVEQMEAEQLGAPSTTHHAYIYSGGVRTGKATPPNRNGDRPRNPAVSLDRAIEIAYADLAERGIDAVYRADSGMDWERGQWVWELEFRSGRNMIEYYINVDTGEIVKFEWDD